VLETMKELKPRNFPVIGKIVEDLEERKIV